MKTLLSTYLHELHIPFTRSYADKLFVKLKRMKKTLCTTAVLTFVWIVIFNIFLTL